MRVLPKSLAGQLIVLLLTALVVIQAVNVLIVADERRHAARAAERQQLLARTASVVHLLRDTPVGLHGRIIRTASSGAVRFGLTASPPPMDRIGRGRSSRLEEELRELLGEEARGEVIVSVLADIRRPFAWLRRNQGRGDAASVEEELELILRDHDSSKRRKGWSRRRGLGLVIWAPVGAGQWVNALSVVRPHPAGWAWLSILSLILMAIAISVIVVLVVRRITRPLARMAAAADSLGRGDPVTLDEEGPADVRRTIRAFNTMSKRLRRFVQDRTQLLAAISHDLRTPITTLRLRAEFLESSENRDKILETLDEMQRMIESTLAFAREAAAPEDTRSVDLSALIESLCDDLSDLGNDVSIESPSRIVYDCRPTGLRRAVRNLVENAVTYGQRARVRVEEQRTEVLIIVDDDGPGIPEPEMARVFEPFARLEESRSRDTGGVGLGLAIARTVVRGHGGEIVLENRDEGGLRATVRLPR